MSTLLVSQLDLNVIWKIPSVISKFVVRKFFFSSQSLKACDNIASNNLEMNFILITIYHSKCKSQARYFTLILLLSGNISLNPGPPNNSQIDGLSWNELEKKGLHFLHINVNGLLPKIDEIRFIAKKSKATVIGINETRLDGTIFGAEIYIEDYNIVRCDRDKKDGGVTCYIEHDICFSTKNILSKNIEVIFVDLLPPKTKAVSVGIVYRPPKDTNFLQLFAEILNSLNILENEIFVLGDMNINILQNDVNLLGKNVNTYKGKIVFSLDVKNNIEFCSILGLKQLIKVPTRIKSNTSTLIDHILTSSSEKAVQPGIIETSLSDHQLIFCTRKIKRAKPNKHNYLTFPSMKNFSTEIYEELLGQLTFPDYEKFSCINELTLT